MNILLFEDDRVGQLAPLTIGRPAYAISCGSHQLIELAQRLAPVRAEGGRGSGSAWSENVYPAQDLEPVLRFVRPYLQAVEAANAPNDVLAEGTLDQPTLFINARVVPAVSSINELQTLIETDRECIVTSGESVAAAVVKNALELPSFGDGGALPALLRELSLPTVAVDLPVFGYPHDVIRFHIQALTENLNDRLRDQVRYREIRDGLFVAENVNLDEYVVTDTRRGPIVIDELASIGPFCYLAGPAHLASGAGQRTCGAQGWRNARPTGQGRRRG